METRPSGRLGRGGNAFEDDHREYPVGVLLVGGGTVGDHAVETVALLAGCHDGSGLIGAVAELDRNGWVGSQVVEPGRMLGGARLRTDHKDAALVVNPEAERHGRLPSGARSG